MLVSYADGKVMVPSGPAASTASSGMSARRRAWIVGPRCHHADRGDLADDAEDDWHTVRVAGEARLGIQLAPDHLPPQGPTEPGHPQQQIHLDLFEVYTDPAGHPFCLCWG